ncbi:MAG: TerC/Alx family metal homeostasis membrane protein [Prolixibacteraceae bacterium]|jgi:tellurite resistance protein TerC|nr:TerC/Alx family metal homeostasis membrane protein [Prolixibacteraceae bacterium]
MISNEVLLLGGFIVFIVAILMFDLLVVGRGSHIVSSREALGWTTVWVALAIGFYFFLRFFGHLLHGIDTPESLHEVAQKYAPGLRFRTSDFAGMLAEYRNYMSMNYLSGYFIEETLSIDNVFVILLVLKSFSVPFENYKTVLFWGILGAIVLRFIFIFAGAALIQRFEWILLVFGAFLVFQGGKILFKKNSQHKDPHEYGWVKYLSRHIRLSTEYVDNRFTFKKDGKNYFTPLFLVLVIIEFTDLLFAMDSIPAIFSVSLDPYVVFFSNIFAIIGLRSLFFLIFNMVEKFRFLSIGVSILLVFVGLKLLFHHYLDEIGFKSTYSLYFVLFVLVSSVLLSALFPKKTETGA